MSLYQSTKMEVRVGSELYEEFGMKVGVYQGCAVLLLVFALENDIITEHTSESSMNELLLADIVNKSMKNLSEMFLRCSAI